MMAPEGTSRGITSPPAHSATEIFIPNGPRCQLPAQTPHVPRGTARSWQPRLMTRDELLAQLAGLRQARAGHYGRRASRSGPGRIDLRGRRPDVPTPDLAGSEAVTGPSGRGPAEASCAPTSPPPGLQRTPCAELTLPRPGKYPIAQSAPPAGHLICHISRLIYGSGSGKVNARPACSVATRCHGSAYLGLTDWGDGRGGRFWVRWTLA